MAVNRESREFSSAQTTVSPPPLVSSPRKSVSFRIWPDTEKLRSPWPPALAYWTGALSPGVSWGPGDAVAGPVQDGPLAHRGGCRVLVGDERGEGAGPGLVVGALRV